KRRAWHVPDLETPRRIRSAAHPGHDRILLPWNRTLFAQLAGAGIEGAVSNAMTTVKEVPALRAGPDARYPSPMRHSAIRVAILGILAVIAFQWFAVQGSGGNWTILFCSGEKLPPPPDVAGEMYQFPDSYGFDGQFYFY